MTRRERKVFEFDKSQTLVVDPAATRKQVKLAAGALRRNMPKTEKAIDIRAALEAVRDVK